VRLLLPEPRILEPEGLVDAYPWPQGPWTRACMVMSLDGAIAGPDGVSGSLSSPTDRSVLAATRALADAYLVGARTVRAEGYRRVLARPELSARRSAAGSSPAPTLAVVSGGCRFDWTGSDFQRSERAPIILTGSRSSEADRESARRAGCEVVVLAGDRVDPADALAALHLRGLVHVTVEGGPDLLAQVVAAGLLDEVDLTLAPRLVGASSRPVGGDPVLHGMRLVQLLEEDGFLFGRYVRQGAA
jgi:riboflavin biosynthesis pyrimidine reductase